ncbi:MAG: tetratricopeptide repeat protein, partial [Verrucomicrobiota bacterium]
MNTTTRVGWPTTLLLIFQAAIAFGGPAAPSTNTVRVAAAQAARRVIDFRLKPDQALAAVDQNPRGHREGGDALNWQRDMRARLFRERNPEAFRILIDKNPPVLDKVPIDLTSQEAGRIMARALTVGEEEFKHASGLAQLGKTDEAITAFERLRQEFPATWIDRRSQERLAKLQPAALQQETAALRGGPQSSGAATSDAAAVAGLAAKYPDDAGIESDSAVLFADNFESGDMKKWDQQRNRVVMTEEKPNSGRWCVQMPMERGKNHGGDAIK